MSILYVGLGIALISGISAMLQIGNNLNNILQLSDFKKSEYFQSPLPAYDRQIMEILNNYSGPDSEVCLNVKQNFNNTLYEDGELFLSTGTQSPSTSSLFINSCVLVNRELNHRVLIKKNNLNTFNLFSCYLKNENFCNFELNK